MFEKLGNPEKEANPTGVSPNAHATVASLNIAFFQMNITKLYVPAATLFKNNNISFLENMK